MGRNGSERQIDRGRTVRQDYAGRRPLSDSAGRPVRVVRRKRKDRHQSAIRRGPAVRRRLSDGRPFGARSTATSTERASSSSIRNFRQPDTSAKVSHPSPKAAKKSSATSTKRASSSSNPSSNGLLHSGADWLSSRRTTGSDLSTRRGSIRSTHSSPMSFCRKDSSSGQTTTRLTITTRKNGICLADELPFSKRTACFPSRRKTAKRS